MNKNENKKPRICDVLGVEVGERFLFCNQEHYIDEYGNITTGHRDACFISLVQAINNPEKIVRIEKHDGGKHD